MGWDGRLGNSGGERWWDMNSIPAGECAEGQDCQEGPPLSDSLPQGSHPTSLGGLTLHTPFVGTEGGPSSPQYTVVLKRGPALSCGLGPEHALPAPPCRAVVLCRDLPAALLSFWYPACHVGCPTPLTLGCQPHPDWAQAS